MFLPIGLNLEGRSCLIVGGGSIAAHKAHILRAHGARLRVVAQAFNQDEIWQDQGIACLCAAYTAAHLEDAQFVIAATNAATVNEEIVRDCRASHRLVQRVDKPSDCDWILSATIRRGAFTAAFSTDGLFPALTARIRKSAEHIFGDDLARLCEEARTLRMADEKAAGDMHARNLSLQQLAQQLDEHWYLHHEDKRTAGEFGKVYLVGAGPGDPGLITVKGVACLRKATVVVHDALANPQLLDLHCAGALRIDVSKRKGRCMHMQPEINQILVEWAKKGHTVVRLKGGDPMIFGRGGEEARTLMAEGIDFEIVPGVSSLSAVPAYAGIPITDREYSAASVGFYSLHRRAGAGLEDEEWRRIADGPETLVLFMGMTLLAQAVDKLKQYGRPGSTPIALISQGTLHEQQQIVATLDSILAHEELAKLPGPGLIVIGNVVNARDKMQWFKPNHQATTFSIAQAEPAKAREILLVRHAEVAPENQGRYLGVTDAPLSEHGLKQAAALASVASLQDAQMVFSSPMLRVRQTLSAAMPAINHPVTIDDLHEINFGTWENHTFADVATHDPAHANEWIKLHGGFAFPQGESIEGFQQRVAHAAEELMQHAAKLPEGAKVAIFAHGVTLRFLLAYWIGLPLQTLFSIDVAYASVTTLRLYGKRGILQCLNNTTHLQGIQ